MNTGRSPQDITTATGGGFLRGIKEVIILAGGLGTRLRPVISDKPKCMAPVAGKPFLHYLIAYLQKSGVESFIFSVGYMREMIAGYVQHAYPRLACSFSVEKEPLGTGGAVKLACALVQQKNVFVCNGDTLFKADCRALAGFHEMSGALCTLALKPMTDFDRYGAVELHEDHSIKSFAEKQFYPSGLINGGVYALNAARFLREALPEKFSFEKDFLEKNTGEGYTGKAKLYGMIQEGYFIDIGIPEDYRRAQQEAPAF
jgi:D-glycero-alpha-D-manno-heptose 1-phosphate guanylyltransferase